MTNPPDIKPLSEEEIRDRLLTLRSRRGVEVAFELRIFAAIFQLQEENKELKERLQSKGVYT